MPLRCGLIVSEPPVESRFRNVSLRLDQTCGIVLRGKHYARQVSQLSVTTATVAALNPAGFSF